MSVFTVSRQHCRLSKYKQTFNSGKETKNKEPEITLTQTETDHFPLVDVSGQLKDPDAPSKYLGGICCKENKRAICPG